MVKSLLANVGNLRDLGSIPGWGRSPGGRAWQPTPVFSPGESHGERSLVGYSPLNLDLGHEREFALYENGRRGCPDTISVAAPTSGENIHFTGELYATELFANLGFLNISSDDLQKC